MCKIKAIVEFYASKHDTYGNSYNFVVITNTETGKIARGNISGNTSNMEGAMRELFNDWSEFKIIKIELPIRQFNRYDHGEYIGCTPDQINSNILAQWEKE